MTNGRGKESGTGGEGKEREMSRKEREGKSRTPKRWFTNHMSEILKNTLKRIYPSQTHNISNEQTV